MQALSPRGATVAGSSNGGVEKPEGSWSGVELRHLAALAAVAREGSFRGAAASLGYVQSAVSQQLIQLERLVGARLVERESGSKDVSLTPVGELLVGHAREILARVQAARADLSVAGHQSVLRVGVSPGVATGLLPGVLRGVRARAPELELEPVESPGHAALAELVERGEVDVAFAELPLPSGPFESHTVLADRCVLLAAAGSEWADRMVSPGAEDLARASLVVLDGARSTADLESWFAAQGLAPTVAVRAGSEATLRASVAGGLGVAIVARRGVEPWGASVLAIDLEGIVPPRRVAVYWHGGRRHGGALDIFREVAAGVADRLA